MASCHGHVDIVMLLLQSGANVNQRDYVCICSILLDLYQIGNAPIHFARRYDRHGCIVVLHRYMVAFIHHIDLIFHSISISID